MLRLTFRNCLHCYDIKGDIKLLAYSVATHETIVLCKPTEHFESAYPHTKSHAEFLCC